MTAQGTPQSQIESLQRALAAVRQNAAIEIGVLKGQNQRLRDDIAARPLNPSAVFTGFLQDQVAILKERIATLEARTQNSRK